ncbi:MAG TPA: NUDIX hydrolase [Gemmatimonadaceae bacterium]|jgi:ADP-ribose pyrophosphatase|nr:NUDIX hydrolase [Gemmatimonadaceae bacterium]
MAKSSYLERLPRIAQKRGSAAKGQIELVTRKKLVRQIDEETASELKGSALGKNGKRIGILLEDEVHMVVRDAVKYPSGATGAPMRIIGKTQFDGVNGVVALAHCEGFLYLRRIFRHPVRSWEIEAVRGKRETGMSSRATARKEVKEELGYPVRTVTKIGTVCPETALLASILDVYWVELGPGPRKDEPEPKEAFGPIEKLTPEELMERIGNGEIRDSYTITATMLAQIKGFLPPANVAASTQQEEVGAGEEQ